MKGYISFFIIIVATACSTSKKAAVSTIPSTLVADGKLWSSLFQQRAAEYRALCLQAYNIARFRVDELYPLTTTKPKAIITDIDETFLDNSPYAVHQALQGKDYTTDTWRQWTGKGVADTLTGALSFFNYAASKNVEIFYITNREEKEREGTLQNLKKFNFPMLTVFILSCGKILPAKS